MLPLTPSIPQTPPVYIVISTVGQEKRTGCRSCLRRHRCIIITILMVIFVQQAVIPLMIMRPWEYDDHLDAKDISVATPPDMISPNTTITPSSNNTAKPNAYTPALDQPFDYANGTVKMRGVNLGGWLVLEPFITPSLFRPDFASAVKDEWTLTKYLGRQGPGVAKKRLEDHYASWVTEDTFKKIQSLGLNHVRIPIGYWAMGNLRMDEPYVPNVSWTYLLRGIEWARKYGIRVMVELHVAPGSENGGIHSGRSGQIHLLNATFGTTNAERTLRYLQHMATFFSSPNYAHVTPIMGLLNEPAASELGVDNVMAWYKQAFETIRKAAGPGKGPWVIIHDGFLGLSAWAGFMSGSEQLMIDVHRNIAFDNKLMDMDRPAQLKLACEQWGSDSANSTMNFGPTMVGEFSVAVNDCATYLNGVGTGHRWDGTFPGSSPHKGDGTCFDQNNPFNFDAEYKTFLSQYFLAQVEAFEQGAGWFFWNFKTERSPLWSYFDGVEFGWIPKDANNRGSEICGPSRKG